MTDDGSSTSNDCESTQVVTNPAAIDRVWADMQDEQATCGKGLAAHAALPEQLGTLLSAMAELLENHTRSLPLEDANAMLEREAYDRLIKDQHVVATSLKALAAAMRGYRDLPIAPHDESTLTDQRSLHLFDSFIRAEEGVLALLQRSVDEHRVMRSGMRAE